MRISARLKASGTSSKLKDESFLSSLTSMEDVEDDIINDNPKESESEEEESDFDNFVEKSTSSSPKKSKKSAPKARGLKKARNSSEYSEVVESLSKKTQITRKKLKRTGGYVPPIENETIGNKLLSSTEEWVEFITEQNSTIKRKNRHLKTVITGDNIQEPSAKVTFSSFKNVAITQRKVPLQVKLKSAEQQYTLTNEQLNVDGKIAVFNAGHSIFASCFCECSDCVDSDRYQAIYTVSGQKIAILSAEICSNRGIVSVKETGYVIPPKAETFKSVNICGSVLSVATNRGIYFLDCQVLHQNNLAISLDELPMAVQDISCHAWRGDHVAFGTHKGTLHIFNTELKEIFQKTIKFGSAIYSIAWKDEFTVFIGGIFPKIFSVDLRDPHIIETEVSALASLPRVKWSEQLKSILFADAENHGRRLEKQEQSADTSDRLHQPIGTFDSMVHDMSTSPNHNILASACASGSVHLEWISKESGVELEKRIFSASIETDGSVSLNTEAGYVTFHSYDTVKLYPSAQACTSVSWCPNPRFPGLLATGFCNGMIVLLTTDRFFI